MTLYSLMGLRRQDRIRGLLLEWKDLVTLTHQERAFKLNASMTPAQRSENSRKASLSLNARTTLEQKREWGRKGSLAAAHLRQKFEGGRNA